MKKIHNKIPELLHILAFLLYLFGSSMAHIYNGVELSLWLMAFTVIITMSTTVLPWMGIHWLKLSKKGCPTGYWLAIIIQMASWVTFSAAMFNRLARNLPRFHTLIMLTTLLWATWLLVFIYSRHACQPSNVDDTLSHNISHSPSDEKSERS